MLKNYCGAGLRCCRSLKTSTYREYASAFRPLAPCIPASLGPTGSHDVFQQPVRGEYSTGAGMDEKYTQSCVEETSELLCELETALLELEHAPDDGELVGRVFRALHTIKGTSGMFGLEEMAAFTHEVETVFDLVRSDLIPVHKELISLVLAAVDHMRELFGAVTVGTPADAGMGREIIARLKGLEPLPHFPQPTIEAFLGVFTEYEIARLCANLNRNRRVFSVRKVFSLAGIDEELAQVNTRLKVDGELLSKIPRSDDVPAGFIGFELLFASGRDCRRLAELLGSTPVEIDCSLLPDARHRANTAPKQAKRSTITYRLRFQPSPLIFRKEIDVVALFARLRGLGACKIVAHLSNVPLLEDLVPEECCIYWNILLTTERSEKAIRGIFGLAGKDCRLQIGVIDDGGSRDNDGDCKKLGEILLERGDLALEELQQVLSEQKRLGELLVEKGFVQPDLVESALIEQQHLKEVRQERLSRQASASIRVPTDKLDTLVNLVGQLVTVQATLSRIASEAPTVAGLGAVAEEVERLAIGLRGNTLDIRMLHIGTIFSPFERLVRDLSHELGKEAELKTVGAETELDKTVLEKLNEPLVHLVRNCMDHGVEPPGLRERAGKPRLGTICLGAVQSGDSVLITISDDGAGLNKEAIRARAMEKWILAAGAEPTEKELFALVFNPGFSTARKVSSVSGRGVGMDVVKRAIDALRGTIEIASSEGAGTTIGIRIPLELSIIESLKN